MENVDINKYTKEDINYLFKDELRTHYLKREGSIGTNIQDFRNYPIYKTDNQVVEDDTRFLDKIKYKFMLKVVASLIIGACIVGYKSFPLENLRDNVVIGWIKNEYKKDYSKEQVIENIEEISKQVYSKVHSIVPDKIYNAVVSRYINNIKPEIMSFSIDNILKDTQIDNTVSVFNEDNIPIDNGEIAKPEEVIVTSSQISLMDMDKDEILSKNISIALPVNGTITSIYGAREEVFENVGYHTGIDIANSLNTSIQSATDGVVISVQEMDKYYGNNIEIEKDGVVFKYAHLNQINVKEGDNIKQGDIIGLMGSTGMSTGSHLHFEIKINGRSVDPELILKFR